MSRREGKVLLKFVNPENPPLKENIFEAVYLHLNVPLIALRKVRLGFQAITEHQNEIDKLTTPNAKNKLRELGLEVKLHPKVKAEKSIICRKVESTVGEKSKEEIKSEIMRCNEGLKVEEVVKFGYYTHVFKIEFETLQDAEKAKRHGILCFNTKIADHQIETEKHTDIRICFHCYKLEDHSSEQCPNKNVIVCSECAGNHSFKECTSRTKKCLNCHGPHRTMAMACPLKKEIIKRKRREEDEKKETTEERTYAKVAEKTIERVTEKAKLIEETRNLNEGIGYKALIMVMDAHVHNLIQPGSYSNRLNELLKANGLEEINIPTPPDSNKLLNQELIGETLHEMRRHAKLQQISRIGEELEQESEKSSDEDSSLEEIDFSIRAEAVRDIDECGARLIALETEVRKNNLTPKNVAKLFKQGKIKYAMYSSLVSTDRLESLIKNKRISANLEKIIYLPPTEFKKRRNAPMKSPVPMPPKKHKTRGDLS